MWSRAWAPTCTRIEYPGSGRVTEAVTGGDDFDVVPRAHPREGRYANGDSNDIDLVVPNPAIGYSRERTASDPLWWSNAFEHVIRGGPAGGGYSSARDLLAFAEVMRPGRLVTAAIMERLWSPKPELQSPDYGFGFGVGEDTLGRSAGHSGGFPGISFVLDIYLDTGWTIVVL